MKNISFYRLELNKFNGENIELVASEEGEVYKAIGQFDWISIYHVKFSSLIDIIEDYYQTSIEQYNSSMQVFYGYCFQEEAKIFDSYEDWTYQFLSFIDLQNEEELTQFKNYFDGYDNIRYLFLETLDKHSFIILVKGNTIRHCIEFIYSVASYYPKGTWNLAYSVLVLNNGILFDTVESEDIDVSINFKINHLEQFLKYSQCLENKIGKEAKTNVFLGNSDYTMTFSKIKSTVFFRLFYNNELLDRTNEDLLRSVKYTHTFISTSVDKKNGTLNLATQQGESVKIIHESLVKLLEQEKKYAEIKKTKDTMEISASFIKIINLLKDMNTYDKNSKYFIQIILPVLYECVLQLQVENQSQYKSIYDALQEINLSIYSLLNTNFKTGHDYFNLPALYYTPAKLMAFYSKFLRKVRDIISNITKEKIRYEFLISPKLHNAVSVVSYTGHSEEYKHRFLSIHMPVYDLFHLSSSLITLTHEIGHFVADDELRCREKRMSSLIQGIVSIVAHEIVDGIQGEHILSHQTENYLVNYLNWLNEEVLFNVVGNQNDHRYYLVNSEKSVRDLIISFMERNRFELMDNIYADKESTYSTEMLKMKLDENIQILLKKDRDYSIYSMYRNMERICRECYSDLFAIQLLNLSCYDFLDAVYTSIISETKAIGKFIQTRLAFVIMVNHWENEFKQYNNKLDIDNIEYLISLIQNSKTHQDKDKQLHLLPGFHDKNIILIFLEYFKTCQNVLQEKFSHNDDIEKIRDYFKQLIEAINIKDLKTQIDLLNSFEDNTVTSIEYLKNLLNN